MSARITFYLMSRENVVSLNGSFLTRIPIIVMRFSFPARIVVPREAFLFHQVNRFRRTNFLSTYSFLVRPREKWHFTKTLVSGSFADRMNSTGEVVVRFSWDNELFVLFFPISGQPTHHFFMKVSSFLAKIVIFASFKDFFRNSRLGLWTPPCKGS